ncbi:hypothetical protein C2857_003542 [Epichloe festucae Fl1]|uniref:Uncharacterized protein n=1 Tax=Epichloe festucae (strain Fl1) TaxID=877507 RepID=A0A7S9KNV2_EPIFF|nr:hypothetical protein C2857_003542 [Epichloe festucae Fl1]
MSSRRSMSSDSSPCLDSHAAFQEELASGDAQRVSNRLSKQKQKDCEPSLSSHPTFSPSHFSSSGTSRYSYAYLAGSLPSLLLEQTDQEIRRNKRVLQLQNQNASTRSGASGSGDASSPRNLHNAICQNVIKSTVSVGSAVSPLSPQTFRRNGMDHQDARQKVLDSHFTKLGILPISPLNASFVNDFGTSLIHEHGAQTTGSNNKALVSPVSETDRELTCVPMRRQSILQTPGVATRPSPDLDALRDLAIEATHGVSNGQNLRGRFHHKQLSLPNLPRAFEQERSVTPCETDYQQLGGMKFGTLRITNASPIPSFRRHSEGKGEGEGEGEEKRSSGTQNTCPPTSQDHNKANPRGGSRGPSNFSVVQVAPKPTRLDILRSKAKNFHRRAFSQPINSTLNDDILPSAESSNLKPPNERLPSLIELIEEPRVVAARGRLSSHPLAPANYSQKQKTTKHKGARHEKPGKECSAKETLDAGNELSARPNPEHPCRTSTNQAIRKGVSRADSGFSSTGSSLNSRGTLSSADSAYSSDASTQSHTPPLEEPIAMNAAADTEGKMTPTRDGSDSSVVDEHSWIDRVEEHSTISARQAQTPRSTSSLRRPSLRARRHDQDMSLPEPDGNFQRRSAWPPGDNVGTTTAKTAELISKDVGSLSTENRNESENTRSGMLQKFLGNSRKEGGGVVATGFASHNNIQTVPEVPLDVDARFRHRSTNYPSTSMKISKPPTISTDSTVGVASGVQYSENNYSRNSYCDGGTKSHECHDSIDIEQSISAIPPFRKVQQSGGFVQHQGKKSTPDKSNPNAPLPPNGPIRISNIHDIETKTSHSSSPTVPSRHGSAASAGARQPPRQINRGQLNHGSKPGSAPGEVLALRPSKGFPSEPPERQPTLRNTFSQRPPRPRQPHQDFDYVGASSSYSTGHKGLRGYPSLNFSDDLKGQSQLDSGRYYRSGQVTQEDVRAWAFKRKHSTLLHRPAFSESVAVGGLKRHTQGPAPRYRVLHSYNSPAYKNIPIWG